MLVIIYKAERQYIGIFFALNCMTQILSILFPHIGQEEGTNTPYPPPPHPMPQSSVVNAVLDKKSFVFGILGILVFLLIIVWLLYFY